MIIYLDELLVLNFVADYLIFLTTARLLGEPLCRRRFACASLAGCAYAAGVFLPFLRWMSAGWMKLLWALLMVRIAFGRSGRVLRQWLLFLLVSSGVAGVEMALGGFVTPRFPLFLFAGTFLICYLLLGVSFQGSGRAAVRAYLIPVTVELGENRVSFTALWDSGCTLSDPQNGEAVLIAEERVLRPLFEEKRPAFCGSLPIENLTGTAGLNTFRCERLVVGKKRVSNALVAIYEGQFSGNHRALWGGETEGSGSDGDTWSVEGMGKTGRLAAVFARAVHRRERYPAASAHAGGGSGTADKAS